MFDIELIRKMFIYENTNKKQFDMKDFKQLLKIDSNLINQKKFKEWIDDNNLLQVLKDWLKQYKLEKTFLEVYVAQKTDFEKEMDDIFNEENREIRMKKLNKCIDRITSKKEEILN